MHIMNEYNSTTETSVKNPAKKTKRLSFDRRIALRRNQEKAVAPIRNKKKITRMIMKGLKNSWGHILYQLIWLAWTEKNEDTSSTVFYWASMVVKLMQPMKVGEAEVINSENWLCVLFVKKNSTFLLLSYLCLYYRHSFQWERICKIVWEESRLIMN